MIGSPTYEKQFEGVKFIIMYSFLTCRRFLHNKEVDNTGVYLEIYTSGLIIMRGMRQASNRAAKTAISFQCWVQESERGTSASWIASISTG